MPRILLVDDDPDILEIMKLELEDDRSLSVDVCRSAQQALDRSLAHAYDVIITDLHMPGKDGAELVRELRLQGMKSLIIIYSGHDMGAGIRQALDSGADHYLARCGDPEREFAELRALIRKCQERAPEH